MTRRQHEVYNTADEVPGSSSRVAYELPPSPSVAKSDRAATLAQQLGSEGSWADAFLPQTPATNLTPAASTVGEHSSYNGTMDDRDDAPPSYESISRVSTMPPAAELPGFVPESSTEPLTTSVSSQMVWDEYIQGNDPTREYSQSETYQSITGTFTFYDYLNLATRSGSISITLDPQPGDGPATLIVSTGSGSVKIEVAESYMREMSKTNRLPRPINAIVKTEAGSITVKLPIGRGSTTQLTADMGSIKATLYAAEVGPDDNYNTNDPHTDTVTQLQTQTKYGSQHITVKSLQGPFSPITRIKALHHAQGRGQLQISYPKQWQGVITANNQGLGRLKITGKNLQYQHFGDSKGEARRGKGEDVIVQCEGRGGAKVDCSG